MAFQLTMPGLEEEPFYRGLLLFTLSRSFTDRVRLLGVDWAWSALLTSLLFGLAHDFRFSDGHFSFDPLVVALAAVPSVIAVWVTLRAAQLVGVSNRNVDGASRVTAAGRRILHGASHRISLVAHRQLAPVPRSTDMIKAKHRAFLFLAIALAITSHAAESPAPADSSPVESQQKAAERLSAMTKFLASLPAYQVTCRGSYDVLQDSGQKLEFLEVRELALQRPDRLRVRHRSSDGNEDLLVFDGKDITLFNDRANVYAQAPQPGSLDDAIVYFVRDLKMRLPLARLFTNRSSDELARRLQSVVHIERTELLPVPSDHIAGRVGDVDVQLWIAEGDRPLPMRVVLTYVDEPGQPQYRADFQDWKTAISGGPDAFRFSPPKEARRIVFAAQLPPTRTGAAQRGDTEAQP